MIPLTSIKEGLTEEQVVHNREVLGNNALELEEDKVLLQVLKDVVTEPMFIILLATCVVYFVVGQIREGFIMLISIFIVAGISLFQEYRSKNAVKALKKMSGARAVVIRNGITQQINTDDVVTGDILLLEEGAIVAADGIIMQANDFSMNESILTGESFAVYKSALLPDLVYRGTLVSSGSATVCVTATGTRTEFGKIGTALKEITAIKTPLQVQIRSFVKNMVWIGAAAFILVVVFNYFKTENLLQSFLQGLTLAMSILPEEIPVAFSTFQALGAFRLLRNSIIVKQPQFVETLGSATVICVDKTGTLTQNKMSIEYLYDAATGVSLPLKDAAALTADLVEFAMWSSETIPFDPMEKAIHLLYESYSSIDKRPHFNQVHEYPIAGKPPMMTHIFRNAAGETIIAAKGAPEGILRQSNLSKKAFDAIAQQVLLYAKAGYRVLGVGKGSWEEKEWPLQQASFQFEFLGLIAFSDPPKENIQQTIQSFIAAGISVKMITGDYAETALAIASQIGLPHNNELLTGEQILQLSDSALQKSVATVNIYARMFPEAKLRIIEMLKKTGAIVAMTGDGVNDAPALKAAHIGIAMGNRGSEVAKSTASLIITDDDLGHMVEAVALGRKIYDNLKKAIRYIVSIHIPIILIVTVPLLFHWKFSGIFSPVHVIFLELIMGPTCSIIYENEPIEPGTMLRPPRKMGATFLSFRQLFISIVQGLMITVGCLGLGYYYMQKGLDIIAVRTIVFICLLFSNIFLTQFNRSFTYSILKTIQYKNNLVVYISIFSTAFIAALLYLPALQKLFTLQTLSFAIVIPILVVAFACTAWLELYKIFNRPAHPGA